MKTLTEQDLNEIFGAPVPTISTTAPDYASEAVEKLFREVKGHLVPDFDLFPVAGIRDDDGDITPDAWIFDSFDNRRMIEEILDGTQYTHGYRPKVLYNSFGERIGRVDGANGKPLKDDEFDQSIDWRLRQIAVRDAGDVSITQSISERFQKFEFHNFGVLARKRGGLTEKDFRHEKATHTQFDRMIFEEGQLVGADVKIVQLRTGDQTPTQFRPEEVMSWARCSFSQAVFLVRCYRYLDVTFEISRWLNKKAAARDVDHPANVVLTNWNDPDVVRDRLVKIDAAAGPDWWHAARWDRDQLRASSGKDFEEKYPEGRNSIVDLARAMKELAEPKFDEPVVSEDIDLASAKSVDDRYEQAEDGLFYDSATVSVDHFGEIHDRFGKIRDSFEPVYVNPDGSPVVILTAEQDDDAEESDESYGSDDIVEPARDSEAFGYWHMSVIPTDHALTGQAVQFYLKAMKVVARAKSVKKLDKLRLLIFDMKPKFNYTQKKKFWEAWKLRKAEILFERSQLKQAMAR